MLAFSVLSKSEHVAYLCRHIVPTYYAGSLSIFFFFQKKYYNTNLITLSTWSTSFYSILFNGYVDERQKGLCKNWLNVDDNVTAVMMLVAETERPVTIVMALFLGSQHLTRVKNIKIWLVLHMLDWNFLFLLIIC